MAFVDKGSDLACINFLAKSCSPEVLEKALDRTGLVQKEVIVHGKNGDYRTKKWVKDGEETPAIKPIKKKPEPRPELPATPINIEDGMFKGCVKLKEGEELPEHIIKSGKRPPKGWREIVYNPSPDAEVWVGGKDSQNRLHALYSPKHDKEASANKFTRVLWALENRDNVLNSIRGIKNSDVRDCLLLMFHQGTRPGSTKDTKAKVQAYGATTLEGRHIQVNGDEVALDFIGKEGIHHHHIVSDPELKSILKSRKQTAGDTSKLFPQASDRTCNAALKGITESYLGEDNAITCKDLRTMLANHMAREMIKDMPVADNKKSMTELRNKVGDHVCAKLGNKRTMALNSYISPSVFTDHSPEGMKALTQKKTGGDKK